MTMNSQQLMDIFSRTQTILSELGEVLKTAVRDLRDKDEELRVVHDQNENLAKEKASLSERLAQTENDLWQARRQLRETEESLKRAEQARDDAEKLYEASKTECVKLRDVILNVAAATDGIINPAKDAVGVRPTPQAASAPGSASSPGSEVQASPPSSEGGGASLSVGPGYAQPQRHDYDRF